MVDTRRWNIRAGSVSFSLSDDSSMAAVAAAMACVTSFGNGDGVRDEDDPIDGIDSGDLLTAIIIFRMCTCVKIFQFLWFSVVGSLFLDIHFLAFAICVYAHTKFVMNILHA